MQYNHHCIISFDGFNWSILAMDGSLLMVWRLREDGICLGTTIDMSGVDVERYAQACLDIDRIVTGGLYQ